MFQEVQHDVFDQGQLFQQDNARIHTTKEVQDWINEQGILTMQWPPYSPDLNPIEHMWSLLKHQIEREEPELYREGASAAAKAHFLQTAVKSWDTIEQVQIHNLIGSMPARCRAVIEAGGWQTKY